MSASAKPKTGSQLATEKASRAPAETRQEKPERIRPERNLEKWPIWQPSKSKNAPEEKLIRREINLGEGKKLLAEVEIGFTHKGVLTTEDQKTYYALLKHWEDKGRPDQQTFLSLKRLSKILKKGWGTNVIDSLTRSLVRLRITPFIWTNSYYDGTTKETKEVIEPFTILSDLKIIRRKSDGHVTKEAGYFRFNDHILKNLLANHTKPLLLDTVLGFKSEIAQILYTYLDLILADKTIYARRTAELFGDLGLKGKAYKNPSKRQQVLAPALQELEGVPLTTGRIMSIKLERTKDEKDYKLVVRKGAVITAPKINHYRDTGLPDRVENLESHNPVNQPPTQEEQSEDRLTHQAKELVAYFYERFFTGKNYQIQSNAVGQAISLITQYGFEKAKYIVDFAHREAPKTNFDIQTFGGIIQYTARALDEYERRRLAQEQVAKFRAEEEARAREEEERERQFEEARAKVEAYLDQLPTEEYQALLSQAQAQAVEQFPWLPKCNEATRQSTYRRLMIVEVKQRLERQGSDQEPAKDQHTSEPT